jgi:S1/P1 Nuclease
MPRILTLVLAVGLASPAFAWNEKGHSVVARLAWRQLTEQQRSQVSAILKKHPHYDEYLAANRPAGFSEDEWVFMRAACWSDWVRSQHAADYNHGTWYYINYPYIPPGSKLDPAEHQPPKGQKNAVWAMNECLDKIKNGSDVEKAVYMTWFFHLVGDIHQPLHCVAMFSEDFPNGDQGGNLVSVRLTGRANKLHSLWDGLLGTGTTATAINRDVELIEAVMKEKAATIEPELAAQGCVPYETFY